LIINRWRCWWLPIEIAARRKSHHGRLVGARNIHTRT
jgi:hypothetical protein